MSQLTYREAAKKVNRSVRTINRWRRHGMPMTWAVRDGNRVRVVELKVLQKWLRERLKSNPAHQYRMRAEKAREQAAEGATRP